MNKAMFMPCGLLLTVVAMVTREYAQFSSLSAVYWVSWYVCMNLGTGQVAQSALPHSQACSASFPGQLCLIPRPALPHSQACSASFPGGQLASFLDLSFACLQSISLQSCYSVVVDP